MLIVVAKSPMSHDLYHPRAGAAAVKTRAYEGAASFTPSKRFARTISPYASHTYVSDPGQTTRESVRAQRLENLTACVPVQYFVKTQLHHRILAHADALIRTSGGTP